MQNSDFRFQISEVWRRPAFTLMELLIVMAIMSIMAMLAVSALARAAEQAKADRTRSIISKLDQLIGEKWESYRTRAVPIRITAGVNPRLSAAYRLNALRELQRAELPDRITDVLDGTGLRLNVALAPNAISSVQRGYYRSIARATGNNPAAWTAQHQGAECLYLIVSMIRDGDKSATEFFSRSEIGDVDEDGMKEILDGWGQPIEFARWPSGFTIQNGAVTTQTSDSTLAPDPFDPAKVDARWYDADNTNNPFELRPLIFSAGPDKAYDVNVEGLLVYTTTTPPNDPYYVSGSSTRVGQILDANGNGTLEYMDNLTNHFQETP